MSHRVLIVDDEQGIRQALKQVLEYEDLDVRVAASGGEAITLYTEFRPHLVFLDVKMAGLDGLETLTRLRDLDVRSADRDDLRPRHHRHRGRGHPARRVRFPGEAARHRPAAAHGAERAGPRRAGGGERAAAGGGGEPLPDGGRQSRRCEQVRELVAKVGPTAARVLITGENGTGKELVARALHEASPRRDQAFVEVNCAAIPSELIESELFGHMKGSFTGAFADRAGKFEQADGGTLFLDEVGDMSLPAQAKLLRVLQEGVVTRIGGAKSIQVDVRVLAATNKDLESEIAEGRFREDLLYRLNVVPIEVPALRERLEDVPALVEHFAEQLASSAGVAGRKFSEDAVRRLQSRPWPGQHPRAAQRGRAGADPGVGQGGRARRTSTGCCRRPTAAVAAPGTAGGAQTFETFKQEAEKNFLIQKLREHDWNVSETARALKMPRSNLYKKIERYGLSREPA